MIRVALALGACLALTASVAPAHASVPKGSVPMNSTAPYAASLEAAANTIDRAVAQQRRIASVPDVRVPPPPLSGPPRFSPSLDDWLATTLNAAHAQKDPKKRAATLRAAARTLRHARDMALAGDVAAAPRELAPTLAAILAQAAYHQKESTTQAQPRKSWWQLFLEWLAGLLDKLFGGLFSAAAGVPLLGRIVAVLTIALFAFIIILIAYRLAQYFMATRRQRSVGDTGDLLEDRRDPAELYAQSLAAAAQGRYARAISLAFRASLLQLDVSGVVQFDPARTAGEYRHAVRRSLSSATSSFDELAHAFTMAAYAEVPVSERDWRAADGAYLRFEPLLDRAEARRP